MCHDDDVAHDVAVWCQMDPWTNWNVTPGGGQ